jgi:hypothetical protein
VPDAGVLAWAGRLEALARIAFALLVVISPFGAGRVILARPVVGVPSVHTDFAIGPADLAIPAVLTCWLVALALRRRLPDVGPRFAWVPVGVVLFAAWASVPLSLDPGFSAWQALRLTLIGGLAAYVATEIRRPLVLLWPVALMLAIQSVVALAQVAGQGPLGLTWLGERQVSLDSPNASFIGTPDGSRLLRAYGLSPHPNILGGLLAFGLLIVGAAIAAAFAVRERAKVALAGLPLRLGLVGVMALGSAGLVATFSRGAWLALAGGWAAALVLIAAARQQIRGWLLVGVIAAGVLAGSVPLVGPYLAARTTATEPVATETRSIGERLALAELTIAVLAERPWLGTGLGTLPRAMEQVRPDFGYRYQPAHLVPLTAAAETGIVGGTAVIALALVPVLGLWRTRARRTPELIVATALLVAIGIVGMVDYYPWTFTAGRTWAAIAVGLWAATYLAAIRDPDRTVPPRDR